MKNLCLFGGSFFKIKIADVLNLQGIKYLGKDLSYLKNWGIEVYYCWNYGLSKLLLHFIEYRLDQLNKKHTKIAVTSTIQYFEGHSQKKCLLKAWSFLVHLPQNGGTVKFFQNWTETIFNGQYFQVSKYQTFGLIKMHNMSKIWFVNNKINLLKWNKRHFPWIFNGFLPETAPLTILAIKRGLLYNFTKTFKGRHFMAQSSTGLKFSIAILNSKSSKLALHSFLENMSKKPNLDLKKRGHFFKFCFMFKVVHFSITRFDILIFCNILHLEMDFENLH